MSTDLQWIREKARKEPKLVFTSLYHHVTDVDNLRACYDALPKDRAVGIDRVTKEEYGRDLECRDPDCLRISSGSVVAGSEVFPCSRSLGWEHGNTLWPWWLRAGLRPSVSHGHVAGATARRAVRDRT